jgi:dTDP-4-amino-4,6-dideoxygalactose transaminase
MNRPASPVTERGKIRDTFLSFSPPLIGEEEIQEVIDTLRSEWITTGPKTRRFEQELAAFLGADAALAVSSATHAMLVGLAAMGVGVGDEVITTPLTFCSTVHVIEQLGGRPILADVEPDTLTIDPQHVERAITPRTKVLLPVHLYGHPCEMDSLLALARRHTVRVLEDAAHAIPTRYKGRMVGTLGDLTAFSFYATKNLTTAEGGALTGDAELVEQARIWSLHGMSRDAYRRYTAAGSWFYEVVVPGFKCNMTDIAAALGLRQLRKLPDFQKRRRRLVALYGHGLADVPEIELPTERPDVESAWHLYPIRLNLATLTIDRARFIEELKARNIGASVHFIPIHLHPYYRDKYGYRPDDFPVAHANYHRLVSLPLNLRMSDADAGDVIGAVRDIVATYRR